MNPNMLKHLSPNKAGFSGGRCRPPGGQALPPVLEDVAAGSGTTSLLGAGGTAFVGVGPSGSIRVVPPILPPAAGAGGW
jgi:hypothetical protein